MRLRHSTASATSVAALFASAALLSTPCPTQAQFSASTASSQARIADFSFFEEALTPYGDWVEVPNYGLCWHPDVEDDWAPYTNGYWAYTDAGWTWVSHEPYGSIVFHYGRWLLTSGGWCWVPGADWAPAWVSWRASDSHVGWAPLPPEVPWHSQRGISSWVDVHTDIGPAYYRFCAVEDFATPVLTDVLLRPSLNLSIMLETNNLTSITLRQGNVFCGGPQYRWVRQYASSPIPVLRITREENIQRYYGLNIGGNFGTVQNFVYQGMLVLPGPQRVELSNMRRFQHARTAEVSISRGWYSDSHANERLRSHLNREWENREAILRRNPAAFAPAEPEIRVRTVTTQEKRSFVNELSHRGEIIQPSSRFSNPSAPGAGIGSTGANSQSPSTPGSRFSGKPSSAPTLPGASAVPPTGVTGSTGKIPSQPFPGSSSSSPGGFSNPPAVQPVSPAGAGAPAVGAGASPQAPTQPYPRTQGTPGQWSSPGASTKPNAAGRSVPVQDGSQFAPATPSVGTTKIDQGKPKILPRGEDFEPGVSTAPSQNIPGRSTGFGTPKSSPASASEQAVPGAASRQFVPVGTPSNSRTSGGINPAQPNGLIPGQAARQPVTAPQPFGGTQPPESTGARSYGFGAQPTQRQVQQPQQQQPPVSGARSSIVPAPPTVSQQPAQSPAPPSGVGRGSAPQGAAPGGGSARGQAAPPPPPSGSGVSISTTPSNGTPTQKKKPGDPGYVPGAGQ